MVLLLERSKLVVEGAGAVAVAALMQGRVEAPPEGEVCAVLSGGNVDASLLSECIRLGETAAGRRMVLSTVVPDRPGALAGLLRVVADHGGNVVDVEHLRDGIDLHVRETAIKLVLQTRGPDSNQEILDAARAEGFSVRVERDAIRPMQPITRRELARRSALAAGLVGTGGWLGWDCGDEEEPQAAGLAKAISMGSSDNGGDPEDLTAHGNLDLVHETGARWVRIWIRWDKAQPLPPARVPLSALGGPANDLPGCGTGCGFRYVQAIDAQIAQARAAGLGVILVTWHFPRWANGTEGRAGRLGARGSRLRSHAGLAAEGDGVPHPGRPARTGRPLRALDRLAGPALLGARPGTSRSS